MILLIAETPVAGTVVRLADWIGRFSGGACHALVRRNYPHNAFRLPVGAFGSLPDWERYLARCIRQAHTLIVHNVCDERMLDLIFQVKSSSTCAIYQYHSPPNEPPQYDYAALQRYSFDTVLAVAQGHSRFIEGAIPVPNIIVDSRPLPVPVTKAKTIFSPHMRSTNYRWSNKFSERDQNILRAAEKSLNDFKVVDAQKAFGRAVVTHEEILLLLQATSVVIDDINTGLFHQTALEALKAGCVVLSGADLHAIEDFCMAALAPPPPFIKVAGIEDVLATLGEITSGKGMQAYMCKSNKYAKEYLAEERLARCYFDIISPYLS